VFSPRGAAGAAVVDGKIHVIGGRGPDGAVVAAHEVFDVHSGTWSKAAPLPKARDHLVVIAVAGKIHVIGGRMGRPADRTGEHDVYDPATDKMDCRGTIADSAQWPCQRLLSQLDHGAWRRAAARPHIP
jgi:hypothetical protein